MARSCTSLSAQVSGVIIKRKPIKNMAKKAEKCRAGRAISSSPKRRMLPVLGVPVAQQPQANAPMHQQGAQPRAGKPVRIFHQMLWLTYSALEPDEMSNEEVLQFAQTVGNVEEYSIGDEMHAEPANPARSHHKHAYIKYSRAISMRDARYADKFDMRGRNGRTLHPHIEPVGKTSEDKHNVVYYSQKDGQYIASPHLMNADIQRYAETWSDKLNRAETVHEGMNMLKRDHSQIFYLHGTRIKPMLEYSLGRHSAVDFDLSSFNRPPLDLTRAVVLYGESSIGKTCYALAHFKYPLLVSKLEDLQDISLRTDGLVFDEMRFEDSSGNRKTETLTSAETIHLLDMEHDRSLSARYHNIQIRKGLPRIFTTNRRLTRYEHIFTAGVNDAEQYGLDSRYTAVGYLTEDLRRQPGPNARPAQPHAHACRGPVHGA